MCISLAGWYQDTITSLQKSHQKQKRRKTPLEKKTPQRRDKGEIESVFPPSYSQSRISLTTTTTHLLSKNDQLPQMQAFLSNFGLLQATTDKHFPKPPTHYLRHEASGAFSKGRSPGPALQFPGLLETRAPQEGETKGRRHPQSLQRDSAGLMSLWVPALFDEDGKKRLLFLTVPPGDSYHGYESIWGACQLPIENKEQARPEPQTCRDAPAAGVAASREPSLGPNVVLTWALGAHSTHALTEKQCDVEGC